MDISAKGITSGQSDRKSEDYSFLRSWGGEGDQLMFPADDTLGF